MSPVVPYISQPRVSPNALPGVRRSVNAPIEAFGGGVAAQQIDLSGPANVAGNIAQQNALDRQRIRSEAALEADQVAVTRATAATQNEANDFMNGPNGLLRQRGTNAMTIDQDAYDKYGELVGRIRSQLGNDRQRAVYDKYVQNGWVAIQSQTVPHIAREREELDKESTNASVVAAKNAVIQDPLNPVIREHSVTVVRAVVAERAKRLGLPEEAAKNVVDDAVSDIHLSAIQSILSQPNVPNRDRMAAAYFDAHKKELVGKDQLDAERLTKASAVEGDVLRTTDKIVAATETEEGAYAEAAKIENGVLREKVEQRISLVYNRKAGIQRDKEKAAFESGYKTLLAHNYDPYSIPITTREAMGAMHFQNLLAESQQQTRLAAKGGPGDDEAELMLTNEAGIDPEAFMNRKILDVPGLNTVQQRRLLSLQRVISNRIQREDEKDIVAGMTATTKAIAAGEQAASDTAHAGGLGKDPATDAALRGKVTTRQMIDDIARKGPRYAEYLRGLGYYIPPGTPTSLSVETKPAEKKPTISKTTVKRGPDGKITDTTTTITKPED